MDDTKWYNDPQLQRPNLVNTRHYVAARIILLAIILLILPLYVWAARTLWGWALG